jgi:DNA-binding transcriptional LysR family regulator
MNDWAEFRHFRYLLTILEKQGFRAAAEELHTSQPNLTVQARQFQENARIHLLRRSRAGRIRPTETGIAFIQLARLLLDLRDEVIEVLNAIERGEITSVCFGCTPLVDPGLFRSLCSMHKTLLPSASVRPTHGDAVHLVEEVLNGAVDVALVTLPVSHPDLSIEELRKDRLVVCLRKDSLLAQRSVLFARDLRDNLSILYHPKRDPAAHARLLELLHAAGVQVEQYSRASHPSEMQVLVREGFGVALIREGTPLDEQLTTKPIAGVDWTVDTAVIYHRQRHPKTIPILVSKFKRQFSKGLEAIQSRHIRPAIRAMIRSTHGSQEIPDKPPVQMRLLDRND